MFACKHALLATLLSGLAVACSGCGGWDMPPEAKQLKNPVPANSVTLDAARMLYQNNCAKCHGMNGDGRRPPGSMYFYAVQPANFTDAKLMDAMSDGEIFWKITHGRKPMPSFKIRLTDQQRWELVNLLRTFPRKETSREK